MENFFLISVLSCFLLKNFLHLRTPPLNFAKIFLILSLIFAKELTFLRAPHPTCGGPPPVRPPTDLWWWRWTSLNINLSTLLSAKFCTLREHISNNNCLIFSYGAPWHPPTFGKMLLLWFVNSKKGAKAHQKYTLKMLCIMKNSKF